MFSSSSRARAARLIADSTHNTASFLRLISDRFNDDLAPVFLDLTMALLEAIRDGRSPHAPQTICLLTGCLDSAKTTSRSTSTAVLGEFAVPEKGLVHRCDVAEDRHPLEEVADKLQDPIVPPPTEF